MKKLTSIISFGVVAITVMAVMDFRNSNIDNINNEISDMPASAGYTTDLKSLKGNVSSTSKNRVTSSSQPSAVGTSTMSIYKEVTSDGVASFSDVPRHVAMQNQRTNIGSVKANTSSVGTNTSSVGTNTNSVGTNTNSVGTNTNSVGTNTNSVGTNTSSVGTNTSSVGSNTSSVGSNTSSPVAEVIQVTTTAPEVNNHTSRPVSPCRISLAKSNEFFARATI